MNQDKDEVEGSQEPTSAAAPHDATPAPVTSDAPGHPDAEEVQAQRDAEIEALTPEPDEQPDTKDQSAEAKAEQKRIKAEAAARQKADEARAKDREAAATAASKASTSPNPVQAQRDEEAKAQAKAEDAARTDTGLSKQDALLAQTAPGGERTALVGKGEGSTVVEHTAANPRPASGPLDPPITDVERRSASESDADNRVYGDAAGPREAEAAPAEVDRRFMDADGKTLSYKDIFDDPDDSKTFVVAKVKVYEEFVYPNTVTKGHRLAYGAGRRVPRGEADNVKRLIEAASK